MARSSVMSGPSSIASNREDMEGASRAEQSAAKTTRLSCKFQAVLLIRLEAKWRALVRPYLSPIHGAETTPKPMKAWPLVTTPPFPPTARLPVKVAPVTVAFEPRLLMAPPYALPPPSPPLAWLLVKRQPVTV